MDRRTYLEITQLSATAERIAISDVENVLPKLLEWSEQGLSVCLATLYHADGTSPRPRGSQMAIAENGQWFGYLSGGCAEQAIADEGVKVIKERQSRSVRYGLGSPYLDIQLPCGAGIDVWFEQQIDAKIITQILASSAQREVIGLQSHTDGLAPAHIKYIVDQTKKRETFCRWYLPQRKLNIIGAGPNVTALAKLAQQADYQVQALTPDAQTLSELRVAKQDAQLLNSQSQIAYLKCDAYSATVLMFHEHERETKILQHLLNSESAYIGALGSRRAHAIRLESLNRLGFSETQCRRIHGPIGLDIQAKTPAEIGISVLAELTQEFQVKAPPLLSQSSTDI